MPNTLQQLTQFELAALLALPSRRGRGEKAPLLCFLHGYDEAAPTPLQRALTRHGPLHTAVPAEAIAPFIVVSPQLPVAGDLWHRHANAVHRLVRAVQRDYDADQTRCYLTGFSFGANGAFDLPLLQPNFWAAVWAVDPTRLPESQLQEPAWLSIGAVSRRQAYEFVDRLQSKPPDESLLGARVHLDEGEDHVGSARRAYADPRVYSWLLRQRFPSFA